MIRKLKAGTVLMALAAAAAVPSVALAAPTVTNTNDSGPGSLRQALVDAVSGDTIAVPAGTYTLTSGRLQINNKNLTLDGAGTRSTIITAGGASRVFTVNGSPVRLTNMTITGGRVDITDVVECQGGAGICNGGDLELFRVAVVGNVANVTASNSNAPGGAGIFNNGNTFSIVESTIANNQANVQINNSLVLAAGGAGLFNNGSGGAITNSTITDNVLTVNGSCTQPSGCRHGGGGVYNNGSPITFTNTTLANNTVQGTAPVTAGNYFNDNNPPSIFKNSIVSGGAAPAGAASNCDKFGTDLATSQGGNIESADTCGFGQGSDKRNTDPLLAALADNGGPTDTRALMVGSPAIDAAVDCPLATDQRGTARPVGVACDSGSFEYVPASPPPAPEQPPAQQPPASPPPAAQTLRGEKAFSQGTSNDLYLACTKLDVVLIDVIPAGRRVLVSGAADLRLVGQTAQILLDGKVVGKALIGANGSFAQRVAAPTAKRRKNARYQARVGTASSQKLKLERRMVATSIARSGNFVVLRGHITKPFARKAALVTVQRYLSCGRLEKVKTARVVPNARGAFTLKIPVPPGAKAAIYRASTRVAVRPRGAPRAPTFTLPRAVDLV